MRKWLFESRTRCEREKAGRYDPRGTCSPVPQWEVCTRDGKRRGYMNKETPKLVPHLVPKPLRGKSAANYLPEDGELFFGESERVFAH